MRVKIEVGGVIVTDKQKKELEMLGFKISNENVKYGVAVFSKTIPQLDVLKKLILAMTFDDEIHYWDAYRKSPTDPGGYVTALRLNEEQVTYMEGNHGWTSSWYIVSIEEMAKHIQKNWDKDCDRGMYSNTVLIKQNKHITRERINNDLYKM